MSEFPVPKLNGPLYAFIRGWRLRLHPCCSCEKKLLWKSQVGVVGHTWHPSTWDAEAGKSGVRSWSGTARPTWLLPENTWLLPGYYGVEFRQNANTYACAPYVYPSARGGQKGVRCPTAGVTDSCEKPHGCRELNGGPSRGQPVLVTDEPCLQAAFLS